MSQSEPVIAPAAIGILALQGAYAAHEAVIASLGATPRLVRLPADLDGLDGLIMPGGESTTMLKFLERNDFFDTLNTFVRQTPTFGTCAGCILLARDVSSPAQKSFAALDITVERNAYGRQNDSVILIAPTALPGPPLEMVFIRAPRIDRVAPGIDVLATREGHPVLLRQGHLLAATFHPELGTDPRVHQLFLDIVQAHRTSRQPAHPPTH